MPNFSSTNKIDYLCLGGRVSRTSAKLYSSDYGTGSSYVAWWVAEDHNVDWKQGSERIDHLHACGSSAFAFNFAKPFDADGNPCRFDRLAPLTLSRIRRFRKCR